MLLRRLNFFLQRGSAHPTSPGPVPMPAKTAAPMKLEYDVAFARQTMLAILIKVDSKRTNLRPTVALNGTLQLFTNQRFY